MIKWYAGAIPAGSTITSATIKLQVTNATSSTGYSLYEIKQPWKETTATWNDYDTGLSWQTPGA